MANTDQVSEHYRSDQGEAYVAARQADPTHIGYGLNFAYFAPYIQPTDRVLDLGCGNGGMLPHIQRKAASVEGVEVNPAARKIASQAGCPVYAGVEELPETSVYDVAVSNHVLEHIPNVCEVLASVREHIRPGGLFVTKLPIDDIRSRHQCTWSKDDVDYHLQTWTPRLFANTLIESGYEVQSVRVIRSAWHPKLFPLVKYGLGPLAFRLLSAVKHRYQLLAVGRVPMSR